MITIVIFLVIVVGLNLIPQLSKKQFPKTEKTITRILVFFTITFILFTGLQVLGLQLKGLYSNQLTGLLFIMACLLFFVLVNNSKLKLITVALLIPVIITSLFSILFVNTLFETSINKTHKIQTSTTGIMSCGESIRITKSTMLLFDQTIFREESLCLRDIDNIEVVEFDDDRATFLIHHNGEMNDENPYRYTINNNNYW